MDAASAREMFQRDWRTDFGDALSRQEAAHALLASAPSDDLINHFFDFLHAEDSTAFIALGGEILRAVNGQLPTESILQLDDKYLSLLQLISNVDIDAASDFHERAEALYQRDGQSLVRYTRLSNSLRNTKNLLTNLVVQGCTLEPIAPMADASFDHRSALLEDSGDVIFPSQTTRAQRITARLPAPIDRTERRLVDNDDFETASTLWINPINQSLVESVDFYALPATRICHQPTGISFKSRDSRNYALSMSDMFHYFRMSGKTAFKPIQQTLDKAYILPRYGINNYYHALVDKLPALYGYRLLGLDCPIVSTYELESRDYARCSFNTCKTLSDNPAPSVNAFISRDRTHLSAEWLTRRPSTR